MMKAADRVPEADFSAEHMADFAPQRIARPRLGAVPFLFNVPHSGRKYPQDFMAQTHLDKHTIRLSEDCYVDKLFESALYDGAYFMAADFPRAFLDVNRPAFALDAAMFHDMDKKSAAVVNATAAVRAGFGSVPRNVAAGIGISNKKLAFVEALQRLRGFYFPYHQTLRCLLLQLRAKFGEVILLDCHSMPSIAAYFAGKTDPDIVLGDRFGRACCPYLTDLAQFLLEDMGYCVVRNHPYAGGAITARYGKPEAGFHALQIEINRNLYLNPYNLRPKAGFGALQANMRRFVARLIHMWQEEYPLAAAAE